MGWGDGVRRLAVAASILFASVAAYLPAAQACDDCGPGATGGAINGGGQVDVGGVVGIGGNAGGTGSSGSAGTTFGSGGGNPLLCSTYNAGRLGGDASNPHPTLNQGSIPLGTLVYQVCLDRVTGDFITGTPFVWGGAPPPVPVSPVVLAYHARAQLILPVPSVRTWPTADRQIIGVATWLRADNFISDSRWASAGGVTATVTARPTAAVWNMGDGTQVTCTTPGLELTVSAGATDCLHVFTRSSGREVDGRFHGSVSITWHLSWVSNIGPGGGLGNVTRTLPISWRVDQIQSLITDEGQR